MYRPTNPISLSAESTSKLAKRSLPKVIGLFILACFLLFRPITVSIHHIGSISILDIYGVAISYLMIIGLFFNINKVRLDITPILILFFIFYCFLSLAWGGQYRDIFRVTMSFLPFFLVRAIVHDEKSMTRLIEILTWGYILPIFGSTIMVLLGYSESVITGSMVERQAGLSAGVHTLAHLMLFYSFCFALYCLLEKNKKYFKWLMFLLFLGTLFLIFKTYTRTVILGGVIFWFGFLFFWKRKLFLVVFIASLLVSIFMFDDIKRVVTQEDAASQSSYRKGFDINVAASGRIGIWTHNLQLFAELPLTTKLLGVGLGNELDKVPGAGNKQWMGSHNDYMSLTITTGVIGGLLYLMIYGSVFFTFLLAPVGRNLRVFGLSVLFSVLIMNFVSNSYIVRFQMAQLFWFLTGLLYAKYSLRRQEIQAKSDLDFASSMYRKGSGNGS